MSTQKVTPPEKRREEMKEEEWRTPSPEEMMELSRRVIRSRTMLADIVFPQLMDQLWTSVVTIAKKPVVDTARIFQNSLVVINPWFLDGLTDRQVAFLIAHELLHRVLLHHERFHAAARRKRAVLESIANEMRSSLPPKAIAAALGQEAGEWLTGWLSLFSGSFDIEKWKVIVWKRFVHAANVFEDAQINALLLVLRQVHPTVLEVIPDGVIPGEEEIRRLFEMSVERLYDLAFESAVLSYPVWEDPRDPEEDEPPQPLTLEEIFNRLRRFVPDPGGKRTRGGIRPLMDYGYDEKPPDEDIGQGQTGSGQPAGGQQEDAVRTGGSGRRMGAAVAAGLTGEEMRKKLLELLKDAYQQAYGTAPGNVMEELFVEEVRVIPWNEILRRFLRVQIAEHVRQSRFNRIQDWSRRNRRLMNTGKVYVPRDVSEAELIPLLVVVRDTSGSMNAKTLGRITGEILLSVQGSMVRNVLFVDADYIIQRMLLYSPSLSRTPEFRSFSRSLVNAAWMANAAAGGEGNPPVPSLETATGLRQVLRWLSIAGGRGGTSFRSVFRAVRLLESGEAGFRFTGSPTRHVFRPAGVIYFTDAWGEWPDASDRPDCPVLFITPEIPKEPVPFGDIKDVPELWQGDEEE